jgi:peptide/nickel transport system substrate-binding protein
MRRFKLAYCFWGICFVAGLLWPMSAGAGGTETRVVIGANADAQSLDPVLTRDATTMRVLRHIYDTLFYRDRDMKLIPQLAESYQFVNDVTWIIKLRKVIKFHNGETFNAEAVKFTIDFALDPANKALTNPLVNRIERVEIIDDYTVKITTKVPYVTMPENLMELYIAPPKLAKGKGMTYLTQHPVGTGAYRLESWSKDREIVLVRNMLYWQGVPEIDKVVFRVIPEVGPRVAALVVGEVDIIPDVPPHLIQQVKNSGVASVKGVPGARIVFVALDNINKGPMQDVRVRQAMNYGVSVNDIIATIVEGYATATPGGLSSVNKDYDPSLKPYPYDPEKAKKLLKEAGFSGGLNLTLHSCEGRYLKDKEFAQAIAAQLAKIGVNVKVAFHEWGNYLQMLKSYKAGDMHVFGRKDVELEGGTMYAWFKSKASWVTFSDPEIDRLLDKAVAVVDPKSRQAGFYQLQRKIQEAAPWIFLWQQHDLYGVSNRLDWTPRADEQYYLFDAKVKN